MQNLQCLFTFLLSSALVRRNDFILEYKTSASLNLMKLVMLQHLNVFAWRRIISKQIWPDSTEESFINTLYKTIFTKTDTSVQITVLQSVGVRSINRWGGKYLALGDWKRFHHLSFLQQSAATDNSPSSIVTYIVHCFCKADFFHVPLICWGNLISNLTHLTFHGLSSRGNHVDKDFQLLLCKKKVCKSLSKILVSVSENA